MYENPNNEDRKICNSFQDINYKCNLSVHFHLSLVSYLYTFGKHACSEVFSGRLNLAINKKLKIGEMKCQILLSSNQVRAYIGIHLPFHFLKNLEVEKGFGKVCICDYNSDGFDCACNLLYNIQRMAIFLVCLLV